MVKTIDMQDMRYLNLFSQITKINTRFCFMYNEAIVFCVPKPMLSRAIGSRGQNVKRINHILGKRIKVIAIPNGIEDAKSFIEAVVSPVTFKDLDVDNEKNELVLTAGNQSKAALIGRNKRRFLEMQNIVKGFFEKEFRIV